MCGWWKRSSGPSLRKLEDEVAGSGLFEPKVVYGYFPAQADGNDVIVYEAPSAGANALATAGETPALQARNSCGLHFHGSAKGGGYRLRISSRRSPREKWT